MVARRQADRDAVHGESAPLGGASRSRTAGIGGSAVANLRTAIDVSRCHQRSGAPTFAEGHVCLRVRLVAGREELRGYGGAGRWRCELVDRAALYVAGGDR